MKTKKLLACLTAFILAFSACFTLTASAETESITLGNAVVSVENHSKIEKLDCGDVLIYFYDVSNRGSISVSGADAYADILVVGGGGSGSAGGQNLSKQGYGGKGGEVKTLENLLLAAGNYTVSVGDGGASVKSSKTARTTGKSGLESSVSGSDGVSLIAAAGGAAGGSSNVSGEGTASEISGAHVVYGADGESRTISSTAAANGAANTGDGGSGGYGGAQSGAGGSGVVIIRLKASAPKVVASLGAQINKTTCSLRLGASYDASSLDKDTRASVSDIGIVFYPTHLLGEDELDLENEKAVSVSACGIDDYDPDKKFVDYDSFTFYVTIVNIPENGRDTNISFRPFIIFGDETVEYDDVMERSYNYVLNAE